MSPHRAVVLSDLHLGPEGPLATFRESAALSALLRKLADPSEPPTELVLAGDIFDFLQTPGYEGFDAAKAPERFANILEGPQTKPVVEALKTFAARQDNTITLLAGNHDPEMLLPEVRALFEQAVGREGRVRYPDDKPLVEGIGDRWPVWGYALGDDAGAVWIVHGDRWDTHNAIHREELRRKVAAKEPVELPVGSQLVYRVLNRLQPESRWIPELKPELSVVFPLLLYIDPRVTMPFLEEHWDLGERLLGGAISGLLHLGSLFGPEDKLPEAVPNEIERSLPAVLADALREEAAEDPDMLLAELRNYLRKGPQPVHDDTLAEHGGVRRALLRAWLAATRWSERFKDAQEPDGIPDAAERWLPENVVALIAGHTHGPRFKPEQKPAYFNTGTWIPVGKLSAGSIKEVIDDIEAGKWESASPRTFAMVRWGDGAPVVKLCSGREDGSWEEMG